MTMTTTNEELITEARDYARHGKLPAPAHGYIMALASALAAVPAPTEADGEALIQRTKNALAELEEQEGAENPAVPAPKTQDGEAHLGFATTEALLDELRARIEMDYFSGGGGLNYTTMGGRPAALPVSPEGGETK